MKEAAKIKIDVRIGRQAAARFGAVEAASQDIVDKVMDTAVNRARTRLMVRLKGLERYLQRQVQDEYLDAMEFVNSKMVGLESQTVPRTIRFPAPHLTQDVPGINWTGGAMGQTQWAPLKKSTLIKKRIYYKSAGTKTFDSADKKARRYFVMTGKLKTELLRGARRFVRNTGVIRLFQRGRGTPRVTAKSKDIPVVDLRIRIMPRIPARSLNATDGSFERALGVSNASIEKLVGNKNHRPMLAPVFSYYTVYHVPNVVARAMAQAIYQRSLSTDNAVGNMAEGGF
jgi:hypothetical protein